MDIESSDDGPHRDIVDQSAVQTRRPPRIVVVSLAYGAPEHVPAVWALNKAYCDRNDHPFLAQSWSRVPLRVDRAPMWIKLDGIAAAMAMGTEFVVWMDADAYFHDHAVRLDQLIDRHMSEGQILAAPEDVRDSTLVWRAGWPNAGVLIFRNNTRGRTLLAEWAEVPVSCRDCGFTWPLDQKALWDHLWPGLVARGEAVLVPWREMAGHDGDFIRHLAAMPDAARRAVAEARCRELGVQVPGIIAGRP